MPRGMNSLTVEDRVRSGTAAGEARPGHRPRPRRRPAVRFLAAVPLLGALWLAYAAVRVELVAHRQPTRSADAAVVLGAAQYDGTPSGALAGRLDRAAQLYRDGMVGVIIVTGGNQPGDRTTEGMTGFVYLRDRGVPESALLVENGSSNTWEQLLATELILDEHGLRSTILVSDPSHGRRLLDTAAELGIEAQVAPTDAPTTWRQRVRESVGVAVGDVIGFRRLAELDR